MSIFKRKDSEKYWINITGPDGKRIRETTGTIDKKQAQEYHDRKKAELWRKDKFNEKPRKTWDEAVDKYLKYRSHCSSLQTILIDIEILNPFLTGRYIDEIDEELIEKISDVRRTQYDKRYKKNPKEVSINTVNHTLSQLRAILNYAHLKLKWINSVPTIEMLKENKTKKRKTRWLTRDEAKRVLNELPLHVQAMMKFSLATGLRESNVTQLEWKNVDLENKIAWIEAGDSKNEEPIQVPLGKWSIDILKSQLGKHPVRVFSYKGNIIKKANSYAWRKALDRAGISPYFPCKYHIEKGLDKKYPSKKISEYKYPDGFHWHDLRHTWAVWHTKSGTDLRVLQQLGGWATYEMTLHYSHLSPDYTANFVDNIPPL